VSHRARIIWLLVAMWAMGLEFYLSAIPGDELVGPDFEFADKLMHATAYAGIAGALRLAFGSPHARAAFTPLLRSAATLAIAVAYGVSDEIHQMYVPNRFATVSDLIADAVGALIGTAVAHAVLYRRRRDASS
jgi:VanZ family protein